MQPKIIAKRIRSNLLSQKARLEEYLVILDKEEEDYAEKDPDKIIAHINLERNIIDELYSLNKILVPLEQMYYSLPYKKENDLKELKSSINMLTKNIKEKTLEHKERLETIITQVKVDIKGLKKLGILKSSYNEVETNLVDING